MSEHLEAAVQAAARADRARSARHVVDELLLAVNSLIGAVQLIERELERPPRRHAILGD